MAAVATCVVAVGAQALPAAAVGGLPAPATPALPSVSVPTPTVTPSVPEVTVPAPSTPPLPTGGVSTPSIPGPGLPSSPTGSGNSTDGSDPTTGGLGTGTGPDGVTGGGATGTRTLTPAQQRRERLASRPTPMVAGTAAAHDLLDDESSPRLLAASQDFLAADLAIAEIARQKRMMADLKQRATEMAYEYRAMEYDAITARATSDSIHERYDDVLAQWVSGAREAYGDGTARVRRRGGERRLSRPGPSQRRWCPGRHAPRFDHRRARGGPAGLRAGRRPLQRDQARHGGCPEAPGRPQRPPGQRAAGCLRCRGK